MEAKPSHTSTSSTHGSMRRDSFHQGSNMSHHPQSESSQTCTNAPSGTGASAPSATVTTENFDPPAREDVSANHMQALFADEQDLSLAGSWTVGDPQPATPFRVENEPILSPIHRAGAVVNIERNMHETTDRKGSQHTVEAVGILREGLHRKV